MQPLLRRLATGFSRHLGALLMAFGAALVVLGLSVRLVREHTISRAESAMAAPQFEDLLSDASGPDSAAINITVEAEAIARVAQRPGSATAPPTFAAIPLRDWVPSSANDFAPGEIGLLDAPIFEGEIMAGAARPVRPPREQASGSSSIAGMAAPAGRPILSAVETHGPPATAATDAATPAATSQPAAAATIAAVAADREADGPVPDRIVGRAIALDATVVTIGWEARVVNGEQVGNEWQTAAGAAGYHRTSAPLGQSGNTVISGHNNIEGAVFEDLHRLKQGDRIELLSGSRRWEYAVAASFIVEEAGASLAQRLENAKWIGPTTDERITLITCFPPWGNTHRLIVVAKPVGAKTHDPD